MSDDPSLHATTITDSEGTTWTEVPAGIGAGIFYSQNTTPNPNLTVYITGGSGDTGVSWRFADISGASASPYDSDGLSAQNVNNLSTFTMSPTPTPLAANGLVLLNVGLGQGPGLAVTAPSGAVWDLCTYTGETDLDLIENADIMAHYAFSSAGAQTWTFTITNIASNSTSGGWVVFLQEPTTIFPATFTMTAAGTTPSGIGANLPLTASLTAAGTPA